MLGPEIHKHFQTYVSQDHRLAHAVAENYFEQARKRPGETLFVQEWGVGNGNLAACFLSRLQELDSEGRVYPRTHYILCDYSLEILKGVRANARLQTHAGRYSTVLVPAEKLECFRPQSTFLAVSNEIWDDQATKVLLKQGDSLFEEYLQPKLDPAQVPIEFAEFIKLFNDENLEELKKLPPFLAAVVWEHDFQRVDVDDWPFGEIIKNHIAEAAEGIPIPVNLGAYQTLERALTLLDPDGAGYTGFDYGMFSLTELNTPSRPYFNLYGGQYTFMVNFDLLQRVGKSIGFSGTAKQPQHDYVAKSLGQRAISVLELVQAHPKVSEMAPWDVDLLMLQTLQALNGTYKSPYKNPFQYPALPGTPKKQRKQIKKLVESLSPYGVPDTVAYVSESEIFSGGKQLSRLGYREKDLRKALNGPPPPIAFSCINFC